MTQSTLINKMLYASLVGIHCCFLQTAAIQSVLNKAVELGFVPKTQAALSELCGQADHALFPTSVITTIMLYITFKHLSR